MRFPCILLALSLLCATRSSVCSAKELLLTNEWQTVGENETLPAGAHIRMDMTTGEKTAKLLDENDVDDPSSLAVQVEPDGSATQIETPPPPAEKKKVKVTYVSQETYDYDMMYRTLSKLPPDEQVRMGLPELPPGTGDNSPLTLKEREMFQTKMKQIWEARQQELKTLQDESQMDMPELLKDRIVRLQAYLDDPYTHLMQLRDLGDDDIVEREEGIVTDIESVLIDLEYHLADLDMTRDFHTLGGWPLLVSLVHDSVHHQTTKNNQTTTTTEEEETDDLVQRVQRHAAWAIGTAVKNTEEFYPYAVEKMVVDGKPTTPLALLVDQIHTNPDKKTRQKVIYALGSLLRANRMAQRYFLKIDGPPTLSRALQEILGGSSGSDIGLAKRILALTGDIVSDIVLHDDHHQNIIDAFSTADFCQSTLDSLEYKALKETAVRAMQSLVTFCNWDNEVAVVAAMVKVKRSWQGEPDIDPQIRRELLDLVSDTIDRIKAKK
jgi:nucleotide exchange factor SIL1